MADAIAAAGGDDTVSYAQCTWFNKGGGGADAQGPARGGLDGSTKAAPGREALSKLSASGTAAEALAAEPATAADVDDPEAPAAKRPCGEADAVFSAILSGEAPADL